MQKGVYNEKKGSVTIEEIEQQMYNDYIYMSEKERDNFIKDYNETKTKLKEINEVMTDEMYHGHVIAKERMALGNLVNQK